MSKKYRVTIQHADWATHDVRRFIVDKPDGFEFVPGQATELNLPEEKWKDETRPFTFACLRSAPYLEFFIKIYPGHDGVTAQLSRREAGDDLEITGPFGAINHQGPGVFLAGGAGVTPFIAILRDLAARDEIGGNRLIFSNKEARDIILEEEFRELLGGRAHFTLTRHPDDETHDHRRIDRDFLEEEIEDFSQYFYICGPQKMVSDLEEALASLGAAPERIVTEDLG